MTEKSNIYEALALFQEKVGTIGKDKTAQAGSFSYDYADLASIMREIQPVLTECKLAVTQGVDHPEGDYKNACLVTHLCHWESGEKLVTHFPFTPHPDPQKAGSQITYYRRYSLGAILNLVTDEDDDGVKASPQAQQRAAPKAQSAGKMSTASPKTDASSTSTPHSRPPEQCPACGKGKKGVREGPDYPLLQDREDPSQWFHWKKKTGGCQWKGNPDEYVETNRIKQGEEALAKAAAELQAQRDAENEAAAAEHGL